MNVRHSFWSLSATLLLGALAAGMLVQRGPAAWSRGIYYFDEGYYLLEAKTFRRAWQELPALWAGHETLSQIKDRLRQEGTMFPPGIAKPTFSLWQALFTALPIPMDALGNLSSLVAFCVPVLVLYRI